jgi:protein-disulfide isomerase-like protein with CxxC motif
MRATVFLDSLSHWCLVAMPAVRALSELGVELEVVLAPVGGGKPLGVSHAMEAWFYARGSLAYGEKFNAGWCEGPQTSTYASNAATLVALDAIDAPLDTIEKMLREGLTTGALFGRSDVANAYAAKLAGVDVQEFSRRVDDPSTAQRLREGNGRLAAAGADERPTFLLENANGDRALLKGLWQRDAIVACAKALLADERAYAQAGPAPAV